MMLLIAAWALDMIGLLSCLISIPKMAQQPQEPIMDATVSPYRLYAIGVIHRTLQNYNKALASYYVME